LEEALLKSLQDVLFAGCRCIVVEFQGAGCNRVLQEQL
jgi:hypothetical protein